MGEDPDADRPWWRERELMEGINDEWTGFRALAPGFADVNSVDFGVTVRKASA